MSYKDKPQIKLYKFEENKLKLKAIVDDFEEVSMNHNKYEAGEFSIQINFNIPNSQLFDKNMFVQIGNNPEDIFVITKINDEIGEDGKQSQRRTITGYDCRYLFKRRFIINLNNGSTWNMSGSAEDVMLSLISDQCGNNAETKRKLPINVEASRHLGNDFTVSEAYSNLYETLVTIATQSELGWNVTIDNNEFKLKFYVGEDKHNTVKFSTDMDSLRSGSFSDSLDSYSNVVYVGGKGNNESKDVYEGEDENSNTNGLDRFESWDNRSSMTDESEYENEAKSMLSQYAQTVNVDGQGMIKCPYIFREQYNVGDIINLSFSGKSANVQILSVTEHWSWNNYETEFQFGKPIADLSRQIQLLLKKIRSAEIETKSSSTDSVKYYTIPTDTEMKKSEVTYGTIGFTGDIGDSNKLFKLYYESNGTGAKTYHVYFKQLSGSGKLILTSGVAGTEQLEFKSGTYVNIIYVDAEGNVESYIDKKESRLPTDAVLHYSFDEVPELPDGTNPTYFYAENTYNARGAFLGNGLVVTTAYTSGSNSIHETRISDGNLNVKSDITTSGSRGIYKNLSSYGGNIVKIKIRNNTLALRPSIEVKQTSESPTSMIYPLGTDKLSIGEHIIELYVPANYNKYTLTFYSKDANDSDYSDFDLLEFYIGDGSYNTPIIDNAGGKYNATNNGGLATEGVSGKAVRLLANTNKYFNVTNAYNNLSDDFTFSIWVNPANNTSGLDGGIYGGSSNLILRNGASWGNYLMAYIYLDNGEGHSTQISGGIQAELLPANKWSHIVLVKNGTSLFAYVDGVLKHNYSLPTSKLYRSGNPFYLGRDISVITRTQSLDDFQIFSRALSEEEVLGLYLAKGNTPKFYSKFDWWLDNQNQPL